MQIIQLDNFSQANSQSLSVGVLSVTAFLIGLPLLIIVIWLKADYKRHKKPLIEADPNVRYTFWHHIKIVTFPLLSYRITFMIQRKDKLGNSNYSANDAINANIEVKSDYFNEKVQTIDTKEPTSVQANVSSIKLSNVDKPIQQAPPKEHSPSNEQPTTDL